MSDNKPLMPLATAVARGIKGLLSDIILKFKY